MNNKMIKYKRNFIESLFDKIKKLFSKKSYVQEETLNNVELKNEFKNSMIVKEKNKSDANIEILRNRYEEGIIKEEDLSDDEIKELTNYYKKLTLRLKTNN